MKISLILTLFYYTALATKDETSETIVRNLFNPFPYIQGSMKAKTGLFLCLII